VCDGLKEGRGRYGLHHLKLSLSVCCLLSGMCVWNREETGRRKEKERRGKGAGTERVKEERKEE
jgi:hypothetical protein